MFKGTVKPQINYTSFSSPALFFIQLDRCGVSLRCRDVCLLLNIMGLNGT